MIISFSYEVIQNNDPQIQAVLAKIFILFLENNHFIDTRSISRIFFDDDNKYIFDESLISREYLSSHDRTNLKAYILGNRSTVTTMHKTYLTDLVIGHNDGEISPANAYRIIKERSRIIIENNPNDWKFIKGILDKYSSFGERKNIYKLIKKTLENNQYLTYDHAGGSGIEAQIRSWTEDIYKDIYKFKLLVLFDSDKKHTTDFKQEYKSLIEYLKQRPINIPPFQIDLEYEESDLILWHMLYKRSIESYIPLEVIISNITNLDDNQKANLRSLSDVDIDFIQYYEHKYKYISIGKRKVKEQFPAMFLTNFPTTYFEDRCKHHLVSPKFLNGAVHDVSELEEILLKIAKII